MEYDISVLIVNYNGGEKVVEAVESLYKFLKVNFEIIVVDNFSNDGSDERLLEKFGENKNFKLINSHENLGFGRANNLAAKNSSGKYLLLFNNDAFLKDYSINKLIEFSIKSNYRGIIAPVVLNPDGTIQKSWGRGFGIMSEFFEKYFGKIEVKLYKRKFLKEELLPFFWVSGVCFLVKREIFFKIGGFDENYFIYIEDVDFCKRLRDEGFNVLVYTKAFVYHYKGFSVSKNRNKVSIEKRKSQLYYYCKNNGKISFLILKVYLLLKFFFRRDKRLLWLVREFKC